LASGNDSAIRSARVRLESIRAGNPHGPGYENNVPTGVRSGRARLQLRFPDGEVERHFLISYRAAARPWIRMSILVALSTVLGFAIIDHWLLVGPLYSAKRRGRNAWWYHSEADEGGGGRDIAADAAADGLLRDAI
jgi:hypothetical protein